MNDQTKITKNDLKFLAGFLVTVPLLVLAKILVHLLCTIGIVACAIAHAVNNYQDSTFNWLCDLANNNEEPNQ